MPNRMLVASETTSVKAITRASSGTLSDGEKVFGQQQQKATQGDKTYADAHRSAHQREQQVFDPELLLDLPA